MICVDGISALEVFVYGLAGTFIGFLLFCMVAGKALDLLKLQADALKVEMDEINARTERVPRKLEEETAKQKDQRLRLLESIADAENWKKQNQDLIQMMEIASGKKPSGESDEQVATDEN